MQKYQEYHLNFSRQLVGNRVEFQITCSGSTSECTVGRKIQRLHKVECEGLIEEIQSAINGQVIDQYFSIDNEAASDYDTIEIFTTHIQIDSTTLPLEDMKLILMEWLDYINS